MKALYILRFTLDFLAAALLIAALAYWGMVNLAHELIGVGLFMLLVSHTVFNRRWYGSIAGSIRERRRLGSIALNLLLLFLMVTLLATSLLISQSLFDFLPQPGGTTARDLHILVAYWVLVVVGIHVGIQWKTVMRVTRSLLKIDHESTIRTWVLRTLAFCLFVYGVESSFVLGMGTRLSGQVSLDFFWDFEAHSLGFVARNAAIVGASSCIGHYAPKIIRYLRHFRRAA